MATPVILPKQGLQMTEGVITEWLVQEGQKVEADSPLFTMETDKLNIEINAPASGTLLRILRQEGETVPITEVIAVIGEPGEDLSGIIGGQAEPAAQPESGAAAGSQPAGAISAPQPAGVVSGGRIFSTPRARTEAEVRGMDVTALQGSGPEGLIIARDVVKAAQTAQPDKPASTAIPAVKAAEPAPRVAPIIEATDTRQDQLIPLTGMRKAIAGRMMQSLQGMAQANHRMKVDMSEVVQLRNKLKEIDIKVSFTDILIKMVARALTEHPFLNASLTDEGILLKKTVNMGMAVAVANGLAVPVIKDADRLSLREIAARTAELAEKARQGELQPDDTSGGTFTITNLGMFDVDEFTAIINPPESAILAVGKIDRIPVAEGDSIVIRPILVLSLTYDHRIIDGAPAAQFLQRIKQLLQNPCLLI